MSDTAFQTQYRQEFIAGFEQKQSLVRDSVTTEAMIQGNSAIFLVADSGSAQAATRGVNGLIPARADNLTQLTCTLAEWHDLVRKTRFNVFASQGNQRQIMQETAYGVINRKTDQLIITELSNATNVTTAAATATLNLVMKAKTYLQNAQVPWDGNLFALITPAFEGYLTQVKEFGSADYASLRRVESADSAWRDKPNAFNWIGITFIVHPNLPGAGTASETCFFYHKSAIGQAIDTSGVQTPVGYDMEQDYSWARCSVFMGAKLLQNSGVVKVLHDGSGLSTL